jgi:hypothetical protein
VSGFKSDEQRKAVMAMIKKHPKGVLSIGQFKPKWRLGMPPEPVGPPSKTKPPEARVRTRNVLEKAVSSLFEDVRGIHRSDFAKGPPKSGNRVYPWATWLSAKEGLGNKLHPYEEAVANLLNRRTYLSTGGNKSQWRRDLAKAIKRLRVHYHENP